MSSFASIPASGWALAFDNAGNLYVATGAGNGFGNPYDGEILEFHPDGMQISPPFVGTGAFPYPGPGPIGLAFDASVPQNLFVFSPDANGNGDIRTFDSTGTEITYLLPNGGNHFATGLSNAGKGLAFDSAGNLFVAEIGIGGTTTPGDILEFTPGGTGTVANVTPAPGWGVTSIKQILARTAIVAQNCSPSQQERPHRRLWLSLSRFRMPRPLWRRVSRT